MNLARLQRWPRTTQVAALCLIAAVILDAGLAIRAMRRRTSDHAYAPLLMRSVPHIAVRVPNDADLIRQAALRTPFDAGGTAAPATTPGALLMQPAAPVAPVRRPALVGTVVDARGGFVILKLLDGRSQLVHVGERAGDLKLRSVAAGEAVFDDETGARITLRSPPPGTDLRP